MKNRWMGLQDIGGGDLADYHNEDDWGIRGNDRDGWRVIRDNDYEDTFGVFATDSEARAALDRTDRRGRG